MQNHSPLLAYDVLLEAIRLVAPIVVRIKKHDRDLADQLHRAATSAALNTAEGDAVSAGNRRLRLQTALGSAREARAALQVGEASGYLNEADAVLADAKLDRACALLFGLLR